MSLPTESSPASAAAVLLSYQTRLKALSAGLTEATGKQAEARMLQVGSVAAAVLLLILPRITGQSLPLWLAIFCVPIFILGMRRHSRATVEAKLPTRLRAYYERGVERLEGTWRDSGPAGDSYREASPAGGLHLYERDLNILGDGSLFQLLCTARTEIGRGRLAAYLLRPVGRDEVLARQAAVVDLKDRVTLREAVATLGEYAFSECTPETLDAWLNSPPSLRIPGVVRFAAMLSSLALLGLFLTGLLSPSTAHPVAWNTLAPAIVVAALFNAAIGLLLQPHVKSVMEFARTLAPEISMLREGMTVLADQQFTSPKLSELAQQVKDAPASLRALERYMYWVRERDKEYLYWVSIYLVLGTHLAIAIEAWRGKYGHQVRGWLETWAEFEALNVLGGHAYEHPEDAFPEVVDGLSAFVAEGLGHPLLLTESSVRNDVEFRVGQNGDRFYLISGSNMAGKSTLLRSIGTNAVLAMAGAPVRASKMTLSAVQVCGSIATADSLLEGKSRFLAEVDRIRQTIEATANDLPVLFVMDEIFSGTNSTDRRIAAEAVVRTLIGKGAVGALSTHDLSLTEIASVPELHGRNVHMCSADDAAPLDFDYLLKPGVNRQSNALAIARLAGVPV